MSYRQVCWSTLGSGLSEEERSPRQHFSAHQSFYLPSGEPSSVAGKAGAPSGCPEDGCAYGGGGRLSSPSSPIASLAVQLYVRHPRGEVCGPPPNPRLSLPRQLLLGRRSPPARRPRSARPMRPLPLTAASPPHPLYPRIDGSRDLYYYFSPISLRAGRSNSRCGQALHLREGAGSALSGTLLQQGGSQSWAGGAWGESSRWHRPNSKSYCSSGPGAGGRPGAPCPHPAAASSARGGDPGAAPGAGGTVCVWGFPLAPGGEGGRRKKKKRSCPGEEGFRANFCRETRRSAAASSQGEITAAPDAAPSADATPRAHGQHHHHHHHHHDHHHRYY